MDNITYIRTATQLPQHAIKAVINLLADGATVPFIARYRKEATGSLDEVAIARIQEEVAAYDALVSRKATILDRIHEQGQLTPTLKAQIAATWQLQVLEDIYLPYKVKRKTRATMARDLGLEPLAKIILAQREEVGPAARRYSRAAGTVDAALAGARDIIAEWISEKPSNRERLRTAFEQYAVITVKEKKQKEAAKQVSAQHYKDYFGYEGKMAKIPSHRLLAILRGAGEGYLRYKVEVDADRYCSMLERHMIQSRGSAAEQIRIAIQDAYSRLLAPSISNEALGLAKVRADEEAILVFQKNLQHLLLEPPLGQRPLLAVDPGFRTGCKLVALDDKGQLLAHTTIYPHPPQQQTKEAADVLSHYIDRYHPVAIAIGNGTAGRETEAFLQGLPETAALDLFMVSESGASIYSASQTARDEFADLDLTVRGSISIGRRLADPLAELIKIDPKSIGVGQYQHDVDQRKLSAKLDQTVISVVNQVGININTASPHLLQYVSGIGPKLALEIVDHRSRHGAYRDRSSLKKVKGFGAKTYEQAAGFVRVKDGSQPLDDSAVHPERYGLVGAMASDLGLGVDDLLKDHRLVDRIDLARYVGPDIGLPTLQDIRAELLKPGLDPRGQVKAFSFDPYLRAIDDVRVGAWLPGIVGNVTNFGAFVDIGIKENGLIHVSEMADRFVSDPSTVLHVGQQVQVRVVSVDVDRKRIQLSLKQGSH